MRARLDLFSCLLLIVDWQRFFIWIVLSLFERYCAEKNWKEVGGLAAKSCCPRHWWEWRITKGSNNRFRCQIVVLFICVWWHGKKKRMKYARQNISKQCETNDMGRNQRYCCHNSRFFCGSARATPACQQQQLKTVLQNANKKTTFFCGHPINVWGLVLCLKSIDRFSTMFKS